LGSSEAATAHNRASHLAAGVTLASADQYWWCNAAWVEEGLGACCPDHAHGFVV
jgi:hypothetical protein